MKYILPSRELIANDLERMARGHNLDGHVMLGSCDKIVPVMLMGAARLDIPAIMDVGGAFRGRYRRAAQRVARSRSRRARRLAADIR